MCGRFTQLYLREEVLDIFNISQSELILEPRYNICPSQLVPVILENKGLFILKMSEWGFIPFWAKKPHPIINARAENVLAKPTFRESFRKRRCLIPSSGFFEWALEEGQKRPYFIRLKNSIPFSFAGLWNNWTSSEGNIRHTFTILTVTANSFMQKIHHRMPVILSPSSGEKWLKSSLIENFSQEIIQTPLAERMEAWRVSKRINSPSFENQDCIKRLQPFELKLENFYQPSKQPSLFD